MRDLGRAFEDIAEGFAVGLLFLAYCVVTALTLCALTSPLLLAVWMLTH